VIHCLIGREPGDRRQHAISVGGEEDDVRRDRAEVLLRCVRNEVDRIGTAAIFRQRGVIEVDLARYRVDYDVFQHRAEALGGSEDFRLGFGRKADHLGVAAAFKVEHGRVRPAMLVIADQRARGIS